MARKRRGRGEGSIHQRADGLWEAKISLGYDGNGKRRRPSPIFGAYPGRTGRDNAGHHWGTKRALNSPLPAYFLAPAGPYNPGVGVVFSLPFLMPEEVWDKGQVFTALGFTPDPGLYRCLGLHRERRAEVHVVDQARVLVLLHRKGRRFPLPGKDFWSLLVGGH